MKKTKAGTKAAKRTTNLMNKATGGRFEVFKKQYSPLPESFNRK